MSADISLHDQKNQIRTATLAKRDAMPADERAVAAEQIAARAFPLAIAPGVIVSGFMPIRTEISPLPLMRKLAEAGAQLALPVIKDRASPLIMRSFAFGDDLARGQWGIREPKPEAGEVAPDIVIVPLAAFDRAGNRIGYGAGHYDRTLAGLRAKKKVTAVGIAFAAQEMPSVPTDARDEPLDLVLTERGVLDLRER